MDQNFTHVKMQKRRHFMERSKWIHYKIIGIFAGLLLYGCVENDHIETTEADNLSKPLWILNGVVQNSGDVSASQLTNIHAALVWQKISRSIDPDNFEPISVLDNGYQVAQTLPVAADFPISFSLGLYELPPEDVLFDGGLWEYFPQIPEPDEVCVNLENGSTSCDIPPNDTYRWTVGFLVMFQDANNNELLDMSADGQVFTDTVIGSAPYYTLLYIESETDPPIPENPGIKRGLTIFNGLPFSIDGDVVAPNSPIELTMANDLLNQAFMCPNGHQRVKQMAYSSLDGLATCEVVPPAELQNEFPGMIVEGREGSCDISNRTFSWRVGGEIYPSGLNDLCETTRYPLFTGYKVSILDENETPPAWWPCVVQKDSSNAWNLVDEFNSSETYQDYVNGNIKSDEYYDSYGISAIILEDALVCAQALEAYFPDSSE